MAKNESLDEKVFVSEEASIENTRIQEIVWVPGPDASSSHQDVNYETLNWPANWHEPWCPDSLRMNWIQLDPEAEDHIEFDRFMAHSKCLSMFKTFCNSLSNVSRMDSRNLTSLLELIRALRLRRLLVRDGCEQGHFQRGTGYHCFGPSRYWEEDSTWVQRPGAEWYCSDPLNISGLRDFATTYQLATASKNASITSPSSAGIRTTHNKAPFKHTPPRLLGLPPELFGAICGTISLCDVENLALTCRLTLHRLELASSFWRQRTMIPHQDWFWELHDASMFPAKEVRWKAVLAQLEVMRSEVLDRAGRTPELPIDPTFGDRTLYEENVYRPMRYDSAARLRPPIGLKTD